MPVSSGPCGRDSRKRSVRSVLSRACDRETKPRSDPMTYAVSAKPIAAVLAKDGDGKRSGAMPVCLLLVSQKKRNVRRCRLLMTGSPSFSGSNTRERSTTTPGTLGFVGLVSAAPAALIQINVAQSVNQGSSSNFRQKVSFNLIVYECHSLGTDVSETIRHPDLEAPAG